MKRMGKFNHDKNKKWIIDIDKEDLDDLLPVEIIAFIKTLEPVGDKYLTTIRSKSGLHIITKPFNVQKFKEFYPNLDIQTNNPTNLYIP